MPLLLILGSVVLVIALSFWIGISIGTKKLGMSWFVRRRILTAGSVGEATVLDATSIKTTSMSGGHSRILIHLAEMVLEVRVDGKPGYRAPCKMELLSSTWLDIRAGVVVPVRVDPTDPTKVLIDVDAMRAADVRARQSDVETHKARQAALLAGQNPDDGVSPFAAGVAAGALNAMTAGLGPDGEAAFQRLSEVMQILATGAPGTATILAQQIKGNNQMFCLLALRLAVTPQAGAPFETDVEALFKMQRLGQLAVGQHVVVRIDPANRVAIDVRHDQ